MSEAGGVAGECFQAFKEAFKEPAVWSASAPRRSKRPSSKGVCWQLRITCTWASTWCKCTSSPMSTGMWIGPGSPRRHQIQVDLEGCARARVGKNVLKVVLRTIAMRPSLCRRNWCPEGIAWLHPWHGRLVPHPPFGAEVYIFFPQ